MGREGSKQRIELYDSTGSFCGYAVRASSGDDFLLYDKKGKFVARVNSKTLAEYAVKIILSSLPYIA